MIPADHPSTPDIRAPRTSPAYTGTIRPQDAFEICHERYRHCRLILENKISTINPMASVEYNWRPDRPPKVREYVADFERAGEEALSQKPTWGPRVELFRIYYCQGVPYQKAIRLMGVKPGTFDRWMWDERRRQHRAPYRPESPIGWFAKVKKPYPLPDDGGSTGPKRSHSE